MNYPELEFMLIYWNLSQEVYGYYKVKGEFHKSAISTLFYNTDYVIYDEDGNLAINDGCNDIIKPIGKFKKLLEKYGFGDEEL
jgi:acyl-coenzyme A synthetase/AMP-(fatty) acid ligase